jgi:hypothetical protein
MLQPQAHALTAIRGNAWHRNSEGQSCTGLGKTLRGCGARHCLTREHVLRACVRFCADEEMPGPSVRVRHPKIRGPKEKARHEAGLPVKRERFL